MSSLNGAVMPIISIGDGRLVWTGKGICRYLCDIVGVVSVANRPLVTENGTKFRYNHMCGGFSKLGRRHAGFLGADRTSDGRAYRILTIMDEYTRECLAIDVARKLTGQDVLERLSDLFIRRGVPGYLRSDNGSEFTANRVRYWLTRVEVQTLFIAPGSPWENGYIESFNGNSVASCWLGSGSVHCWRPRCSSSAGVSISTPCVHTVR